MSKTPTKANDSSCYKARELPTPNKDNTEVSKTIFMRVNSLHTLLSSWIKLIDKGTKICKSISALKLYECEDYYYPHQTKALTDSLLEVQDGLKNIVDGIEILDNQVKALGKLQAVNSPVIFTWSVSQISENISKIYTSIQKEYALKLAILENIAHCRDENLIEVYVSAWEFDVYFDIDSSEYLFAETGLPRITLNLNTYYFFPSFNLLNAAPCMSTKVIHHLLDLYFWPHTGTVVAKQNYLLRSTENIRKVDLLQGRTGICLKNTTT